MLTTILPILGYTDVTETAGVVSAVLDNRRYVDLRLVTVQNSVPSLALEGSTFQQPLHSEARIVIAYASHHQI